MSNRSLQVSKRCKWCCWISSFMILLISLLLAGFVVVFLAVHTQQTHSSIQVGDDFTDISTVLIPIKSSYKKVDITLIGEGSVFMTSDKPKKFTEFERLPQGPYNYIFLLSGSTLNYTVRVAPPANSSDDACLVTLSIFNDHYGTNMSTVYEHICLRSGENRVTVMINKTGYYHMTYLAHVTVFMILDTITRVYFNTTGLSSPSGCRNLTKSNPSCVITDVNKSYILSITRIATVNQTNTASLLDDSEMKYVYIAVSVFLFLILLAFCLTFAKIFKGKKGPKQESVHDEATRPLLDVQESGDDDIDERTTDEQQRQVHSHHIDQNKNERNSQDKKSDSSDDSFVSTNDGKKSTQMKASRNDPYMSTADSTDDEGIGTDSSDNLHVHSPPPQALLDEMENVIAIERVKVYSNGLIHHCSQYGVTLIIPEEAVQQSATVWFGACLFSDKFKFEGDYVPVSPIVWVYIDQVLLKPAELYIPHHIDISGMEDARQHLFLSTAKEGSFLRHKKSFFFTLNSSHLQFDVISKSSFVKIDAKHFCLTCVATKRQEYPRLPKKYLVGKAIKIEHKHSICLIDVEFGFIFQQECCMKTLEKQWSDMRYIWDGRYIPVTFSDEGAVAIVSLSFEPHELEGVTRTYNGVHEITEDSIDYTKHGHDLQAHQDYLVYPPRIRVHFQLHDYPQFYSIVVNFCGLKNQASTILHLETQADAGPRSSHTALQQTQSRTHSNDINQILEKMPELDDLQSIFIRYASYYFSIGVGLGVNVQTLLKIQQNQTDPVVQIMAVFDIWRRNLSAEYPVTWKKVFEIVSEVFADNGSGAIESAIKTKLNEKFDRYMNQADFKPNF